MVCLDFHGVLALSHGTRSSGNLSEGLQWKHRVSNWLKNTGAGTAQMLSDWEEMLSEVL